MRRPSSVSALGSSTGFGKLDRGRVVLVPPGDDRVEQRDVADRLRDGADLVEARGERDDAEARDGAVGRAQADVAAERRRLLDRAARVGAEAPRREPAGDGGSGAAAGASRHAGRVPRVARRAVGRVLGRRAHRELVGVGLPDHGHPCRLAARSDGRVEHRHVAGEDLRAGRRLDALRRDHVLERDRHSCAFDAVDEPEVGVQLAVALSRSGDVGGMELGRRDLAALDQAERGLRGEAERVDHADPSGPVRRAERGTGRPRGPGRSRAPRRGRATGAARRRPTR